jgi:chromosome segregation ATPase
LDECIQQNAQINDRIRAIKADACVTALHIATLTLDYAVSLRHIDGLWSLLTTKKRMVTQLRTFHESLVEAEIRFIEAKSESDALEHENRTILQRLQTKKDQIAELTERYKRLRKVFQDMTNAAQQDYDSLFDEEKSIVLEYRHLESLEALEQEIQANDARLELMAEGNPGAIKAYEKREEEITRTQEKLEQCTASLENTKQKIVEIREQWEPELDALIGKISDAFAHNFKQIGCAGEVEVNKDEEDFDNWSIQISVRFR